MRVIGLFAVLVLATSTARAGGPSKPPIDLVPFGTEWSCFHAVDPATPTADTPRCERTEAACKATRATLNEPAKMTACSTQPTATVVTYYDPKRTAWRSAASPDDDGCLALRRGLIAAKAYQHITQCEEIGKRFPPAAKLATEAITPGKTWWCLELPTPAPKMARPACTRTVASCEDMIRRDALASTKCKEHATAHVVTFKGETGGWGYAASSTADACASYRDRVLPAATVVSACAPIGAVARPKLDRKLLPKGRGWVCFTGADQSRKLGVCTRTAADCAAQFELDRYVSGASAGCRAQGSAFARHVQGQVFAFPSAALCEGHITEHPDGSRCEAVN